MTEEKNRICPVEQANSLDGKLRRWLQNPNKILSPYVTEGMKVLDVGCGPGFFSIELAKIVGPTGKVFAVDLQEGMLQIIRNKVKGTRLETRIELIKCDKDKISVPEKVDFILAFYMVHEVPDKVKFFESMKNYLTENGTMLLVEPKFFHVTKKEFESTISTAVKIGFKSSTGPKLWFSFSSILKNNY